MSKKWLKSAAGLSGKELTDQRWNGTLTITFTPTGKGPTLTRAVKMDEMWHDQGFFLDKLFGTGFQVFEALYSRAFGELPERHWTLTRESAHGQGRRSRKSEAATPDTRFRDS